MTARSDRRIRRETGKAVGLRPRRERHAMRRRLRALCPRFDFWAFMGAKR